MEKIDILMASFNGEKYIKEQVESILNQTYRNYNLIISDDCSNDSTLNILREYEKKDNRIKVFSQDKNLGYVKNFEFLLRQVTNEYYMLSDQDDIWLPEKVEKSYNKIKNENLDLVFSDLEIVDENLNSLHDSMFKFLKIDKRIKKYNDYRLIYLDNCITGCTIISKRIFLDLILPIPNEAKYLIHDYWIALVISMYGKIGYINEALIRYRQHGNNQVGINKISTKFSNYNMIRNLFIDVKIERFTTFINNERVFSEELKKLNKDASVYFNYIKNVKHINFKKWNTFHKIYRYQELNKYILFFIIMNFPIIFRLLFNLRYSILKIIGKRGI